MSLLITPQCMALRLCLATPEAPTYGLERSFHITVDISFLRPPDAVSLKWCRNINLLPITYASRPRLRGRLTLGRLA
jgi:hypothetical protein